jgi:hypothetical protein
VLVETELLVESELLVVAIELDMLEVVDAGCWKLACLTAATRCGPWAEISCWKLAIL